MIGVLAGLNPRERVLLALLGGVVLPLAILFGLLLPLQEQRTAARAALQDASALQLWVQEQARRAPAPSQSDSPLDAPSGAIGTSGIEQALLQANLRENVTRLSNQSNGIVTLSFESIAFDVLTDWLSAMRPIWGYDVQAILLERGVEAGLVQADLTLVPQE
ncbi:MAG: type II secretion system protein GspM [Pseudoruegeria sp.]